MVIRARETLESIGEADGDYDDSRERAQRTGASAVRKRAPRASSARSKVAPETAVGLMELFDGLAVAIVLVDESGRVVFANSRAAQLLARDAHALEGLPIDEVLAPIDELVTSTEKATDGRALRSIELADGRTTLIGYTLSVVPGRAGPRCAIAFQDVTAVQRLQAERDRLLKLATVGEVLPTLLHELKNPLASMATMLELLIEEAASPALQRDLHAILGEVRRAVLGLDGIGVVGRSLRSASPSAVDLAVEEACAVLTSRATRNGVTLQCDAPRLPLLHVDAGVIRAIVFNLVTNALQACTRGGHVRVGTELCRSGSLFELHVVDDGSGMPPDVLARCTELFFTTRQSGSGIGLAMCKRVIEEAGGELSIASHPGRGTEVVVRVPAADRPAQ